jgi:hypothetical protein
MVRLKRPQWNVFTSDRRFRVLVAGRRFGKTFLSMVELCRAAWSKGRLAWYVAPTYKQAKQIVWKPLKEMTQPYWASKPNETDLRIELITGGTICLRGADNSDSLRGMGLDFVVMDEYASMEKAVWPEVLRPALADRGGRGLFIGTPHGYNHFHDLYEAAQKQPHWARFQYTTQQSGNVSCEELASAARELDERTYRQEFQASFENLGTGIVYYNFDPVQNVRPLSFNPMLPIFWSLDFNVGVMCSVIGQRDGVYAYVLDEIRLENSNTVAACEEFAARTERWVSEAYRRPLPVDIYGDATGEHRDTAAMRTDWQIVRDFFAKRSFTYKMNLKIRNKNPEVKNRVNSVNGMFLNLAKERRMWIDPSCIELIRDFQRVQWKTDPYGNGMIALDKSDPARTHLSDALGYMVEREFGMWPTYGEKSTPLLGR